MPNATTSIILDTRSRFRVKPIRAAEILMLIFLAVAMGFPLFYLLGGSFNLAPPGQVARYGFANWIRAFTDPGAVAALWTSFLLSLVRLIPSMVLSVLIAWLIARTDMPAGRAVEACCWIAYFVPDFPLVLAWILLLDPNFGFLNTLARSLPWADGPLFNPYSFWGIVWLMEYSFTGELERAAALGLLVTVIVGAMMLIGRKWGLKLSGMD